MVELYGVLNKTLTPIKYTGATTDTAEVNIDQVDKTISVNVLGGGLPEVTSADNGKWLEVNNGYWILTNGEIEQPEVVLFQGEVDNSMSKSGKREFHFELGKKDGAKPANDYYEGGFECPAVNQIDWTAFTFEVFSDILPDGVVVPCVDSNEYGAYYTTY